MDRVRVLSQAYEHLTLDAGDVAFAHERLAEIERQIASHAQRGRLMRSGPMWRISPTA